MMFFSNYQDDDFSSDDFEFSEKRFNDIEFSGRKFNELCERRDVVISRLNENLNKNIITLDEYNDWCDKLYNPDFNQETLTECSIFMCDKTDDYHSKRSCYGSK